MASRKIPPLVLFGYDSSAFTQKMRLALRIKRIPYNFVTVPSMMPRPVLSENFHLTYRRIPVMAIGRDIYADTSLILEAIESRFKNQRSENGEPYTSLYPQSRDLRSYRALARGFMSFWIDLPFYRVACGLIPGSVWRTQFGLDRAGLIGHKIDADKLEAKVPRNMSGVDMHMSMLEEHFRDTRSEWIFATRTPSMADLSFFYMLNWGNEIAKGRGIMDLTGGGTEDVEMDGAEIVVNERRYPALMKWFRNFKGYVESQPYLETLVSDDEGVALIKDSPMLDIGETMIPTAVPALTELDQQCGLVEGAKVSIAPNDTGKADPTFGTLLGLSPEEFVLKPIDTSSSPPVETRLHFPRLGFVCRPI